MYTWIEPEAADSGNSRIKARKDAKKRNERGIIKNQVDAIQKHEIHPMSGSKSNRQNLFIGAPSRNDPRICNTRKPKWKSLERGLGQKSCRPSIREIERRLRGERVKTTEQSTPYGPAQPLAPQPTGNAPDSGRLGLRVSFRLLFLCLQPNLLSNDDTDQSSV